MDEIGDYMISPILSIDLESSVQEGRPVYDGTQHWVCTGKRI